MTTVVVSNIVACCFYSRIKRLIIHTTIVENNIHAIHYQQSQFFFFFWTCRRNHAHARERIDFLTIPSLRIKHNTWRDFVINISCSFPFVDDEYKKTNAHALRSLVEAMISYPSFKKKRKNSKVFLAEISFLAFNQSLWLTEQIDQSKTGKRKLPFQISNISAFLHYQEVTSFILLINENLFRTLTFEQCSDKGLHWSHRYCSFLF